MRSKWTQTQPDLIVSQFVDDWWHLYKIEPCLQWNLEKIKKHKEYNLPKKKIDIKQDDPWARPLPCIQDVPCLMIVSLLIIDVEGCTALCNVALDDSHRWLHSTLGDWDAARAPCRILVSRLSSGFGFEQPSQSEAPKLSLIEFWLGLALCLNNKWTCHIFGASKLHDA